MDTTAITELARYYEHQIGYTIPAQTPFAGANFNVTRAGIHADGLLKNEEIYNIFDTGKFLDRPPLVNINQNSGAAGVAHWLNTSYGLKGDKQVDKHSPVVKYIRNGSTASMRADVWRRSAHPRSTTRSTSSHSSKLSAVILQIQKQRKYSYFRCFSYIPPALRFQWLRAHQKNLNLRA